LDSRESGTFPKVRRKKNKDKNVASGISEQQEENSMIFPRLPLLQMEFEGMRMGALLCNEEPAMRNLINRQCCRR
jgi:hypothetical protein